MDIDEELLEYTEKPSEEQMSSYRKFIESDSKHLKGASRLHLIELGSRVSHAIIGAGTVLSFDTETESYSIKFDSFDTPRQISFKINLKSLMIEW